MEYSYFYAIPYLIVFFILSYLYKKEQEGNKSVEKIAFIVLLIFLGLRGFVASDYISYYPFFEELPDIFNLEFTSFYNDGFEFGFVVYSSIIKTLFPNYFCWTFVNSLIDLFVIYWLFRKFSASTLLSFIIFFVFNGLIIEFNLFRNSKAMMLFLLSLPYLMNRRFFPYLLLNVGGCLFHLSSFIFIPLYFILTVNFPRIFILILFFIINIFIFAHISISNYVINLIAPLLNIEAMADKVLEYMSRGDEFGLTLGYFERTFSFIFFIIMRERMIAKNQYNIVFYNCFLLYYMIFNVFLDIKIFAERIPILFMFSYWILYPNALSAIQNKKYKKIIIGCILLFCLLKVLKNNHILMLYDNLLWGIRPFEEREDLFYQYMGDM